jgi:hypothetical protein
MQKQDIKDRLEDAIETDNPPGTDYYGAELDEAEVEAARERMEESLKNADEARRDAQVHLIQRKSL